MADDRRSDTTADAVLASVDVRDLAREAIRLLAAKTPPLESKRNQMVAEFYTAYLADGNAARHNAVQAALDSGLSAEDLIDDLIPTVARAYGADWAADTLSFAEVSIGSARLQESVRSLTARSVNADRPDVMANEMSAPRVLLIVPRPEHHTLGAFVAADQLRRFGYEVDVIVDESAADIVKTLRKHRYVMVGITVAGRRTLASARELVEKIRTTVTRVTPIVLGGSLIDAQHDLKQATGVDHVVGSVRDALEKCGLNIVRADPFQNTVAGHE